ncbi:unnamed protein product [Didymodactylos carnosus]|uniref:Uncharacterized protein n=1 Tax=Didymodactylos carnosus TaxID=1234261 RepID=A0A814FMA0_9BILA|nr:unnamed protein product [Didymodactylos carnosus]CAF0982044.1 unnamed protein product [Didymodactylos carnosus]CAF3747863.1 unnamed protein product [Didymodactylos carnosus]CAF3754554.1 unnamed protein product [Didymodactylos carnosus]
MVLKTDNNPTNLVVDPNSKFLEMKSVQPYNSTDEYLYAMKEDLAEWISSMYNESITANNFIECLENGVLLCKHANNVNEAARNALKLKLVDRYSTIITNENCIYRENSRAQTFNARDNVSNFIKWCRKVGVREVLMFESDDLILRKNEKNFLFCLLEIARYGAKFGVSVPNIIKLEEEIEKEIQRDKQEEIMSFTELQRLQRSMKKHSSGSIKTSHKYNKLLNFVRNEYQNDSNTTNETSPPSPTLTTQISPTDDIYSIKTTLIASDNIDSNGIQTNSSSLPSATLPKSNNYNTFSLTHSNGASWLRSKIPKFSKRRRSSEESNGSSSNTITSVGTDTTIVQSRTLGESYDTGTSNTTEITTPTSQLHKTIGEGKYRIGQSGTIVFIRILRYHVMVRVGGGWDTLENYLNKHDPCRCIGHRRIESQCEHSETPIMAVPTTMKLNATKTSGGHTVALRTEEFPLRPTNASSDLRDAELVITRDADGRHRIGQIVYKFEDDLVESKNDHSEKCQHSHTHQYTPTKEITPTKIKGLSARGTGIESALNYNKQTTTSESTISPLKPVQNEETVIPRPTENQRETNEIPQSKTVSNNVKSSNGRTSDINSVDNNKTKFSDKNRRDSSVKKAIPNNKSFVRNPSPPTNTVTKVPKPIIKEKDHYSRRRTEPINNVPPLIKKDNRYSEQKQMETIENTDRTGKRSIKLYSKKANTTQCVTEHPKISITDYDTGSTQYINDTDVIIEMTRPRLPHYFQSDESYQRIIKYYGDEGGNRSGNIPLDDNSCHLDKPVEDTNCRASYSPPSSPESKKLTFDKFNKNGITQDKCDVLNAFDPVEKQQQVLKQQRITESIIYNIDGFTQAQQNDFDLNDIEDAMIEIKQKQKTDLHDDNNNMDEDSLESCEGVIDDKVNNEESKTLTELFVEQKQKHVQSQKRTSIPKTNANKPFHTTLTYSRSSTMPDVVAAVEEEKNSKRRGRQSFTTNIRNKKRSDSVHSNASLRTTATPTITNKSPRLSLSEQRRRCQSTEILSSETKNNNMKHRSNHLAYDRDSGFDEQDFRRERLRSEDDSSSLISGGSTFRLSYGDAKYRENKAYELRLKALDFTKLLNEQTVHEPRLQSLHNKRNYNYAETKGSEVIYGTTPRIRLNGKYHKNGDNYLTMKMLQKHNDNIDQPPANEFFINRNKFYSADDTDGDVFLQDTTSSAK